MIKYVTMASKNIEDLLGEFLNPQIRRMEVG